MQAWSIRGRRFEREELDRWERAWHAVQTQRSVTLPTGRRGRIDIALDEDDGSVSVIETKATDWDAMEDHRIRPNVRRHLRQLMGYVWFFWEHGIDTHPALIYPTAPRIATRRALIEQLLEKACVQIAWRSEDGPVEPLPPVSAERPHRARAAP